VQANAIYVVVIAFASDGQSWVIEALTLEGETSEPDGGAFAKLTEIYETAWPDSFDGTRRIDAFGVDAGFRANVVYNWVRGRPKTFALQGRDGWSRAAMSQPSLVDIDIAGKKIKQGATIWGVGTWPLKASYYAELRKKRSREGAPEEPPGACHHGDFLDENYFQQITAESLVDESFKGRTRKVWKKHRPNHFLDVNIYARALADYIGLSRMTDAEWARLSEFRARKPKSETPQAPAAPSSSPVPQGPRFERRVMRSSWMQD
jgi:phage terminase large subunit GpA-like protein